MLRPSRTRYVSRIAATSCLFMAAVGAHALPKVLICAAAASTITNQFTDPQAKLLGTGRFQSVDIFLASTGTPTLAELQAYDAVIVWSNVNFSNAAALGDVLADYVDAGGGVVIAVFANSTTTANRSLTGRWVAGTYNIIPPALGNQSGASSLGSILEAGHPMADGVSSISATTASRPLTTLINAGCEKIATWADGKTLMATHPLQNRCDIGLYPPSNAVSAGFWNQTTDGAAILANSLCYASAKRATLASYAVDQGLNFGGNLASLAASDDDKAIVLCDELDPNAQITIEGSVPSGLSYARSYVFTETSASRNDLSMFTDCFNFSTSQFDGLAFATSTLTDTRKWSKTPAASYVNAVTGSIRLRIRWIPQADIDAGDGWTQSIDCVRMIETLG